MKIVLPFKKFLMIFNYYSKIAKIEYSIEKNIAAYSKLSSKVDNFEIYYDLLDIGFILDRANKRIKEIKEDFKDGKYVSVN